MTPLSPISWKVMSVAVLLLAGGLFYSCPSTASCPLTTWLRPEAAKSATVPSQSSESAEPTDSVAATKPKTSHSPRKKAKAMQTLYRKPKRVNTVLHADLKNFEEIVLDSKEPVLVDFYADWCRPCQMLSPTLDELARETPDARIVKVNVDKSPELAKQFGVRSIPALMIFKNGDLVSKRQGIVDKGTLKRLLGG